MHRLPRCLPVLVCALGIAAVAQNPFYPHSAYEPPAAAAAASLSASTQASPPDLLTTSEKTHWDAVGPYAEAVALARKMAQRSPWVRTVTYGTSPEGRPMVAMIVAKGGDFTPEAARKDGKLVILIQSGIHSGEIESQDTTLMLVRDIAITKRYSAWLDHIVFVAITNFNLDGHEHISPFNRANQNGPRETGLRETARGLNLNRDYMKADTLEMRAWLKLYNQWLPDFMFDNHVTDGADMQYDVTWDMARNQDIAEPARNWVNQTFVPGLDQKMADDGHGVAPYGALRSINGKPEFFMEVFSPRYSHLYTAVQDRPCLLVETHSLKSTRTRAWADYDIMKDAITTILRNPAALRQAVLDSDQDMMQRAGDRNAAPVYLAGKVDATTSRPIVYRSLKRGTYPSAVTGGMVNGYLPEPDNISTVIHDRITTTAEAQIPLGYLIPAGWNTVADELRMQGVEMHRITQPVTGKYETYKFSNVTYARTAFEGHVMVDFDAKLETASVTLPGNSYWVPMKQRRARLILALLEPMAPDSLIRWGLMDPVFGGGGRGMPNPYLSEPMARRLMANSPELRQQFQAALAADASFAADPQARLQWWYEHSPYQPRTSNVYPIVRVWDQSGIRY
ncbi:MAG TPA: M14 family zinc carboxypeptidase [Terriglobales bacterium]|nr:M14 family zinc carboxypeptidase [Terriglobales bacterium]